jgi:parallel beta-helix repeat protein
MPTGFFVFTTNSALINCSITDYQGFDGVSLYNCSGNVISNNNVTTYGGYNQDHGIGMSHSVNNTISDNFVSGIWWMGIAAGGFSVISGNKVTEAESGLVITGHGNKVFDNEMYNTIDQASSGLYPDQGEGMQVSGSDNEIFRNTFRNNGVGIQTFGQNNTFYLNTFINNTNSVEVMNQGGHNWDNGTMGNYWDTYQGEDSNSDGIGDTPYIISENNKDIYPLMEPLAIPEFPSWSVFPLLLVGVLFVVFFKKRMFLQRIDV